MKALPFAITVVSLSLHTEKALLNNARCTNVDRRFSKPELSREESG